MVVKKKVEDILVISFKTLNKLNILIEKCRKKNRKAQFEVYHLFFKAMYNTACRIIGDIYAAEDITQEAFLSAFDKIKTYKGDVTFGSWLKRIVINKSIDFLRKRKILLVPAPSST